MFHLRSGEEINYFLTKKESKNTNNRHLCLLDFFEATDLHVNIEDCSKEEFKCFEKILRQFEKNKRGAVQENISTKHKVRVETISK